MRPSIMYALGAAMCAILSAAPLAAAANAAPATSKTTTASSKAGADAWAPVTVKGKLIMDEPTQHLVVVQAPDGVPYDVTVTPATSIRSGDEHLKPAALNSDIDDNVSVRITPEKSGDIATSLNVLKGS